MVESKIIEDWRELTYIDSEELSDYISRELGCEKEDRIEVKNFHIRLDENGVDEGSLLDLLANKFPHFVLDPKDRKEAEVPYHKALTSTDYKENATTDGTYGEFLLFMLVDGFLDMPMVSHKIGAKQNPRNEGKSSDGVYYGEYNGSECLGIGEAKMYTDRKGGIKSAVDSTHRFHGAEGPLNLRKELDVASKNIRKDLTKEQLEYITDRLSGAEKDYKLIHPIFIGYESDRLAEIQRKDVDKEEMRERVRDALDEDEVVSDIKDEIEKYSELDRHLLVFLFLPLADIDLFREKLKNNLFPHSEHH